MVVHVDAKENVGVAHAQSRIIFCNFFYGEPVGYLLLLTRLTLGLSRRVPMLMGRPKLKPTEKKRPVGFAISPDLYRRLAAFAKREKRSISSAAEVLLSKILEDKNAIK